jgi:hypothetical protein
MLSRLWATIQQAHTELPEDGALSAETCRSEQMCEYIDDISMHLLVLYHIKMHGPNCKNCKMELTVDRPGDVPC